jgi:chromosome segregation ATPase
MPDDEAVALNENTESATTETTSAGGETDTGSWPPEVQAEYTKKTQELAEERKSWDAERTQQTQQLQQYAQQLQQQQYARQAAQQQAQQTQQQSQQGQGNTSTMLDQLRQMPYLDGNTAAQLMERMIGEGINPLNQALQQRDQALAKLYKDYKQLRDSVGQSQGKQAAQDLDARLTKVREEQGLPNTDVVNDLMRDVYYSHEGDTLDQDFPDMLRKRWEGIQKVIRDSDRATAKKAKESPFPSKGGEVSPTSGKTGGYKSPEERANELWPMLNPGQSE